MAVEDIRIKRGFVKHPKTVKLVRRLGLEGPWALLTLWDWASGSRMDGRLSAMTDEDVEIAAGWTGDPGALIPALIEVGFLDRGDDGVLQIHDWEVEQPWVVGAPERSAVATHAAHISHRRPFSKSCPICRKPARSQRRARSEPAKTGFEHSPSPLPSSPIRTSPTTEVQNKVGQPPPDAPVEASPSPAPPAIPRPDLGGVVGVWNRIAGAAGLAVVRELTEGRRRKVQSRSRPERDLAWWEALFARVAATPFLRGENDRGWRASFDFVIRSEEIVAKILEDGYARTRAGPSKPRPAPTQSLLNLMHTAAGRTEKPSP